MPRFIHDSNNLKMTLGRFKKNVNIEEINKNHATTQLYDFSVLGALL